MPKKILDTIPKVSLIVVCQDEENRIGRKIQNSLKLDYPADKLEIVLVLDGASDRSEAIIELFLPHPQIKFSSLPYPQGKLKAQQAGAALATGEILLFSDTVQVLTPEFVKSMEPGFSQTQVGGVAGKLLYQTKEEHSKNRFLKKIGWEGLLQHYENFLKESESRVKSLTSLDNTVFAVRKELWPIVQPYLCQNDITIPVILSSRGYKVAFAPKAVGFCPKSSSFNQMILGQKTILQNNIAFLAEHQDVFNVKKNPILGALVFHKILRLFFPVLFFLLFLSNLFISNAAAFYDFFFWGQLLFYSICLFSLAFERPVFFYLFSRLNLVVLQVFLTYTRKLYVTRYNPIAKGR
ncbi:glycosyltransferase [Adhaeribacter aquaticus]|uniref:glycosyltransferase n=1 Tax=Adhaeribacter aquaticus TaxID=299567 RepID=UPI00146F9D39|nr:glycosyltransferase [Adhaeribacter aquaticus]